MAEAFLSLDARERADILRTVAARSGRSAVIRFAYPSAVEEPHGYVPSEVLLEFGGRNVIDPNERHAIVPDNDQLPGLGADYDAMRAAAIIGDDAPGFDALIEEIRTLEAEANRPD